MAISYESQAKKKLTRVSKCRSPVNKMGSQKLHCCAWLCLVALYFQAGMTSVWAWAGKAEESPAQSWSSNDYYNYQGRSEQNWGQHNVEGLQLDNQRDQQRRHSQGVATEKTKSRNLMKKHESHFEKERVAQRSFAPPHAGSSWSGQIAHDAAAHQERRDYEYNRFSSSPNEHGVSHPKRTVHKTTVYQPEGSQQSGRSRQQRGNPIYDIDDDNEPIENFMERPEAAVPQCKTLPQRPVDFVFTLNPQSTRSYLNVSRELKEKYIPELAKEIASRYPDSRFGAATFGHMHAEGCFNITIPLTNDVKRFTRKLQNKVEISFGGRSPELSLLGGAMAASSPKLGWTSGDGSENSRIRVVLLTTDDISDMPSAEDISSPFLQLNGNDRDSCHVRLPTAERVGSILDRDNTFLIVMPSGRDELRKTWNSYASEANYSGRSRLLVSPLDVERLNSVVLQFLKTFRVAQCIHSVAVESRLEFAQKLAAEAAAAPSTEPAPIDPEVLELWRQDDMLRRTKSGYLSSTWVQNSTISRPSSKRETVKREKNKKNKKINEAEEKAEKRRTPVVSPTAMPENRETMAPKPTSTTPQVIKETTARTSSVAVQPTETPEKRETFAPKPTSTTPQVIEETTARTSSVVVQPTETPGKVVTFLPKSISTTSQVEKDATRASVLRGKEAFTPEASPSSKQPPTTSPTVGETTKKRESFTSTTTRKFSKPISVSPVVEETTGATTAVVVPMSKPEKPEKPDIKIKKGSVENLSETEETEGTSPPPTTTQTRTTKTRTTKTTTARTTTATTTASESQAGKIAAVSSAGAAVVAAVGGVLGYTKLFNKPPVPPIDFGEGMDVPQTEEVERDLVAGVNFA